MRATVFVDGENLRFAINKIFANKEHTCLRVFSI